MMNGITVSSGARIRAHVGHVVAAPQAVPFHFSTVRFGIPGLAGRSAEARL
jgi:hypothetical protein